MKVFAAVVFLTCFTSHALCCSCPPGAWSRPRDEAIREAFCWSQNVYLGTVVGATCTCTPAEPQRGLHCRSYSVENAFVSEKTLVLGTYAVGCSPPYYISTCSDVVSGVAPEGYAVENTTSTVPQLHNITDCYSISVCSFDAPMDQAWWSYSTDSLPCVYTIQIDTAYKGNFQVGDNITSAGPDVLTSCGFPGNLLRLGTQYLQGVGGVCSPIAEWGVLSYYTQDDWDYLTALSAQYRDDPSVCGEQPSPSVAVISSTNPPPTPAVSCTNTASPPMVAVSSTTSCTTGTDACSSCPIAPPPTFTPAPTTTLLTGAGFPNLPSLILFFLPALIGVSNI